MIRIPIWDHDHKPYTDIYIYRVLTMAHMKLLLYSVETKNLIAQNFRLPRVPRPRVQIAAAGGNSGRSRHTSFRGLGPTP